MMRPLPRNLPGLSLLAVSLAACASQNPGINGTGGDAFVLDVQSVSGSSAVQSGLAQAQTFCGEHGRLFVITGSQVGSSSYRLEFRCIAPNNVLPPPAVVASAPPAEPPRATRGRRAAPASAPEVVGTGPSLAYGAVLPAMAPVPAPFNWSLGTANIPPPLPPVATTPLFAPPPGTVLAVPPLAGPRLPPPDNSPLVALPRLDSMTAPEPRPQAVAVAAPDSAAQPVTTLSALPSAESQPTVQTQALPPIEAQPLPAATAPLSIPPPSFGAVVPSPNPLPGAPSSLPPIAGSSARPVPLPGGNVSGFSGSPSAFTQGFR